MIGCPVLREVRVNSSAARLGRVARGYPTIRTERKSLTGHVGAVTLNSPVQDRPCVPTLRRGDSAPDFREIFALRAGT